MASPFGIFRKHGTILTAGLVVLCMFAFTLADFLRPEHLPKILGMTAFAALFYLLGQPSEKAGLFAAVGAVVGFAVVSFVPGIFSPPPAASTSLGNLSEKELREKLDKRQEANRFMLSVYQLGAGRRPDMQSAMQEVLKQFGDLSSFQPQLRQMLFNSALNQAQQRMMIWDRGFQTFGFAPLGEELPQAREATVMEWIMAEEADNIGIKVSNEAVTDYLKRASTGPQGSVQLTRERFTDLRKELNMSEEDLYDMLRYHIKAKQYQLLIFPKAAIPPEQRWSFYKRTTITQDMDFAAIPVSNFFGALPNSDPTEADVKPFFEQYKQRYPQGLIDPQEGWQQPVEALSPDTVPAFAIPRKIRLAYITADFPENEPTDEEIQKYYDENTEKYPNPAYREEPPRIPEADFGPVQAQKPDTQIPAWAEGSDPKYLPLEDARDQVRLDKIAEMDKASADVLHEKMEKVVKRMKELKEAYNEQGDAKMSPQEISDELQKLADEHDLKYTVPDAAWTAATMTETRIGQAVEVDINKNPFPGQPKASVRTGGQNVVSQMFRNTTEDDVFRPNEAISSTDAGTRFAYWKIEDNPGYIPEWDQLNEEEQKNVKEWWKIRQAQPLAKKRAEELLEIVKNSESKKLETALEGKMIRGEEPLTIRTAVGMQWMQPPGPESQGARIGKVTGVAKAGEEFMRGAFQDLEKPDDLTVLVNADGTEYYVAQLRGERGFGKSNSVEGLQQAFLNQESTPELQTVDALVADQNRQLVEAWQRRFREKYQISVSQPLPPEEN